MASVEQYLEASDLHPIDVVETLAEHYDWAFDRVGEDQIAMAIEGAWRTYSITLAWSAYDETLRMVCTFDMEPPEERMGAHGKSLGPAEFDNVEVGFIESVLAVR